MTLKNRNLVTLRHYTGRWVVTVQKRLVKRYPRTWWERV